MNYEHISEALKFNQADYLGFLMRVRPWLGP